MRRPRAQVSGGDTEAGPVCGRKWPSTSWSRCSERLSWRRGRAETEQASLGSWVASGGCGEVVSGVWPWCDLRPVPQVFTLPKVSAKLKLKLTALEGSRVRRVSVAHFSSCRAEDYGEHHLAVLTNLGDIQVVSLPLLKPQVRYGCIRREDVSGIASCVFTKHGQGAQVVAQLASASGRGVGLPCAAGAAGKGSQGGVAKARLFENLEGSSGPNVPGWKPHCQQLQVLRGQTGLTSSPPPRFLPDLALGV